VTVVGDVMWDVVTRVGAPVAAGSDTPARIVLRPGGAGANVAHGLARTGRDVVLVAAVGDDPLGAEARRLLRAAGVDARLHRASAPTGACVVLIGADGERTMLPDQGANALLAPPDGPPPGRHLHLSGYVLLGPARDAGVAWLAAARRAGLTTSLDAASAAPLAARGARALLDDAGPLDLLLVTTAEAAVLAPGPEAGAVRALGRRARHVVLKRGAQGAAWGGAEGVTATAAAVPPPGALADATGAGDAFAAALLAAWTAGGEPGDCLAAACAAGAEAVTWTGARPG